MPKKSSGSHKHSAASFAGIAILVLAVLVIAWILLKPSPKPHMAKSAHRPLPTVCGQIYQHIKSGVLTKADYASKLIIVTDVTGEDFGSPGYFYYTATPKAFDAQCTPISIRALEANQHLSVYYTDSQHFFIQTE